MSQNYIWSLKMVQKLEDNTYNLCSLCKNEDIRIKWSNDLHNNKLKQNKKTIMYVSKITILINNIVQLKYFIENQVLKKKSEKNKFQDLSTRLDKIHSLLILYLKNEQANITFYQHNNISLLTTITMIFLPLGFIVGYFGMNFAAMGNPTDKLAKGIIAWKHGHKFIIFLIIITILFTYLFLNLYHIYKVKKEMSMELRP